MKTTLLCSAIVLGVLSSLISATENHKRSNKRWQDIAGFKFRFDRELDEVEFVDKRGKIVVMKRNKDYPGLEKRSNCKCRCRSRYHQDQWTCCKCAWTDTVCFPADATVRLQNGHVTAMADLRVGQKVLAVDQQGTPVFSEVRAFMKRMPKEGAVYTTLTTEAGHSISLSSDHLIFASSNNFTATPTSRFAGSLNVGDFVYVTTGKQQLKPQRIADVFIAPKKGVYVPLTAHGTVVVDDVLASCYAAVDHDIAHFFMTDRKSVV